MELAPGDLAWTLESWVFNPGNVISQVGIFSTMRPEWV